MNARSAPASLVAGLALVACSSTSPAPVGDVPGRVPTEVVGEVVGEVRSATREFAAWITRVSQPRTADRFEVWICRVPLDTTVDVYEPGAPRVDLQPGEITAQLAGVGEYFAAISGGRYRPEFVAGGIVELDPDGDSQRCAAEAADRSDATATAVLLVADAEHRADAPGGWGRANNAGCPQPTCAARDSRRAVYVGAADFHPDWGDAPALDLVEHEIGHSLGWPHSATATNGTGTTGTGVGVEVEVGVVGSTTEHGSAIDLMSDSAAPRRTDATRRHGPDVLALERLLSGWIDGSTIVDITSLVGRVTLVPSNADRGVAGPRLAVRAIGASHVIMIEAVVAAGMNDHLPADGIAIHVVDLTADPVLPVGPTGGLLGAGAVWELDGVTVSVIAANQVEIATVVGAQRVG